MKINRMEHPLPQDIARCIGSKCDQRGVCKRYLTIEIDTRPYQWFMDASIELNNEEDKCEFFIEWEKKGE